MAKVVNLKIMIWRIKMIKRKQQMAGKFQKRDKQPNFHRLNNLDFRAFMRDRKKLI